MGVATLSAAWRGRRPRNPLAVWRVRSILCLRSPELRLSAPGAAWMVKCRTTFRSLVSRRPPHLVHAFGFSGHGFQLGPMIGLVIAELITEGQTASPIAPFAIQRFADRADEPERERGVEH